MDHKKVVLLVEDDAILGMAEAEMLSGHGFKVITAVSGGKAVEAVKKTPDISMVLMDINLGKGIDGTQAAKEILKIRELPIVFLTSHSEKEMVDRVKNITSYGYVLKNSGEFVLTESISMAYELFNAHQDLKKDIEKRKKTEKALRASEEKFRSIFENSTAGVALVGLDGRYQMVNPAFSGIFGYSAEDLLTIDFFKITHPDDIELSRNTLQNVLDNKGKSLHFSKRYIHKDGHTIWTEVSSALVYGTDGKPAYFVTHIIDITERIKAEQALKDSEERYRLIADVTTDYFFKIRVNEQRKIIIEYASENFTKTTGRSPDEVNSMASWDKIFHPEDFPLVLKFMDHVFSTGEPDSMECRTLARGKMRWISILVNPQKDPLSGKVNLIFGAVKDITARKNAEEALRDSEERYRFLFNNTQVGIFRARLEDGKIIECNDFFAHQAGYSSVEECCNDYVTSEHYVDPEKRSQLIKELLKKGTNENIDVQMTIKDGTPIWVSFYSKAYPEEGFLVGVAVDITERKKVEEQLINTKAMLETAFMQTPIPMVLVSVPDYIIRIVNPASIEFLGLQDEPDHQGESFFQFKQTWQDYDAKGNQKPINEMPLALAMTGIETKNKEFFVKRKGGSIRWEIVTASPVRNNSGEIIAAYLVFPDITVRKNAEEALFREQEKSRMYLNIAPSIILVLDSQGNITLINEQGCRILECVQSEIIGRNWFDTFIPEKRREQDKMIFRRLIAGEVEPVEYMENSVLTRKGSERLMLWHNTVMKDEAGRNTGTIASAEDITERKKAENEIRLLLNERELLLTEVHHRIKNDMSIISSMLSVQANSSREEIIRTELLETQARINIMFNIYNELYKGKNFSVIPLKTFIIDLIKNIQYLYSVMNPVNVGTDIDDANISRKISFPVGMIVNEVITNSFKYAFPKKDNKNQIKISVKKNKNNRLFICISDNGIGFPEEILKTGSGGFGLKLIEMLSRQTNGTTRFYNYNGAAFELTIPLEE